MDYTSVRCTERLTAALEETAGDRGRTTAEITEWRGAGDGTTIPFSLVQKVHEKLTAKAQPENKVYLHELLEGSELVLPTISQPKRSAELEAQLARLRAKAEQKEYDRMVRDVDTAANQTELYKLGLEVQSADRQVWAMLNFLVTVVGAFVFGYCTGYFAGYSMPTCVFLGLTLGILVFLADLYFLLRTPKSKPKPSAKIKAS